MKLKYLFVIVLIFLFKTNSGQKIQFDEFSLELINEDFNKKTKNFDMTNSYDSYRVLDKGDLLLSRNINTKDYVFLENISVDDYLIKSTIRIGPSKNSSAGYILAGLNNKKLIFEINGKKEFRVFKIEKNKFKFETGNEIKKNGWESSKKIKKADKINYVQILRKNNLYKIYMNETLIFSKRIFFEEKKDLGLFLSGNSKARFGNYILITNKSHTKKISNVDVASAYDSTSFNHSLESHKEEKINSKNINKSINDSLSIKIEKLSIINDNQKKVIDELNNEINLLKDLNSDLNSSNQKLINEKELTKNSLDSLSKEIITINQLLKNLKNQKNTLTKTNLDSQFLKRSITNLSDSLKKYRYLSARKNEKSENNQNTLNDLKKIKNDYNILKDSLAMEKNNFKRIKQAFILRELKQNEISFSNNEEKVSSHLKKNKKSSKHNFYIQIAVLFVDKLKGYENNNDIKVQKNSNGTFTYKTSNFSNLTEALIEKDKLIKKGFKNLQVIKLN